MRARELRMTYRPKADPMFRNFYLCPFDSTRWEDSADCMCNDRCPTCNAEIEPYNSHNEQECIEMIVKITPNDRNNPPGKLADAELHFTEGALEGLKLIGFGIWERRTGGGRNVTFPARQYSVNGERRSFALLRPVADATAQERVRDLILEAYAEYENKAAEV